MPDQLALGPPFGDPPPEDVGAKTHARYRYQWEIGARTCIAMLTQPELAGILCEWHEDHVVLFKGGTAELVSVKHREPSEGPWTLRGLCLEGGVAHLYRRWLALGRAPGCRVFTNGGLNTSEGEARSFAEACHSRSPDEVRGFVGRIQSHLGAEDADDVVAFCLILSIEAARPGRAHIKASNIQDLMMPALAALGIPTAYPHKPYEACVSLVERASRDQEQKVTLGSIADVDRLDGNVALGELLQSRTVTPSQVRAAVLNAVTAGGIPLAPQQPIPTTSVLVRKLSRGGVGPTAIRSAQRERALWAELEARFRGDLPGADSEVEDLRTRVLDGVAAAEEEILSQEHRAAYGPELLAMVRQRLTVEGLTRPPMFPLEDVHLLGLAFQLTDECQVWWSEEFDVEAAV